MALRVRIGYLACQRPSWSLSAPTSGADPSGKVGLPFGGFSKGYLPDQWRLANVAYPLFLKQRRVNDGGGRMGLGKAA